MPYPLAVALIFLTRLPIRTGRAIGMDDLALAVPFFPLVGALVGAIGAAALALAIVAGLPPFAAALLALLATVLATGALHEDGLADTADALGARDAAHALAIMRDSRIGTFGALALLLVTLLRASALAALPGLVMPMAALVAAGTVSRAALPLVMRVQPSARPTGLAAAAGRPGATRTAANVLVAALLVAALAATTLPPSSAAGATLAAALAAALLARAAGRLVGGCTGDTLGAVQQVAEASFLLALAATAGA